jgi:hypothetical protein
MVFFMLSGQVCIIPAIRDLEKVVRTLQNAGNEKSLWEPIRNGEDVRSVAFRPIFGIIAKQSSSSMMPASHTAENVPATWNSNSRTALAVLGKDAPKTAVARNAVSMRYGFVRKNLAIRLIITRNVCLINSQKYK